MQNTVCLAAYMCRVHMLQCKCYSWCQKFLGRQDLSKTRQQISRAWGTKQGLPRLPVPVFYWLRDKPGVRFGFPSRPASHKLLTPTVHHPTCARYCSSIISKYCALMPLIIMPAVKIGRKKKNGAWSSFLRETMTRRNAQEVCGMF